LSVPFTTGTGADLLARLLGPKLADQWKVSVVTDNKAGASGSIGTGAAAKAAPNGLTVLVTATSPWHLSGLDAQIAFQSSTAFTPVIYLAPAHWVLQRRANRPSSNFEEFQRVPKSNPVC